MMYMYFLHLVMHNPKSVCCILNYFVMYVHNCILDHKMQWFKGQLSFLRSNKSIQMVFIEKFKLIHSSDMSIIQKFLTNQIAADEIIIF